MANLADHLFRQARERPLQCALIYEGARTNFRELADAAAAVAGALRQSGVARAQRVGLMLQCRPEFIIFQQALFALGATVIPLNTLYRKADLAHAIGACDLDHIIIESEFCALLPPIDAPQSATLKTAIVAGPLPDLSHDGTIPRILLPIDARPIEAPENLDPAFIGLMLNTSATTGKAKGVMLSIANVQSNYDRTPEWLGLDGDTITLCALPLYNTFGLNQCINALMVTGGTLVLMPRFDAARAMEMIHTHRCNFLPAVPTMLQRIVDHPDRADFDLSSIKRILTGAAPVPAALLERINTVMGEDTVVMTGYGLTEGTAIATRDYVTLDENGRVKRPKSIGRALPGIEMQIRRPDESLVAAGEIGEICLRGPNVMQGYYKQPEETARALRDGWLHTGDLGTVDVDGFAYVVDRQKDVIIRGGQNLYPAEIEEVIYHHPGVSEVAVIGAPSEQLGEVPVAYVALRPGSHVTAEDIVDTCRANLAYYKIPAAVHFLPELPKGPTGKVLKRGLRPS